MLLLEILNIELLSHWEPSGVIEYVSQVYYSIHLFSHHILSGDSKAVITRSGSGFIHFHWHRESRSPTIFRYRNIRSSYQVVRTLFDLAIHPAGPTTCSIWNHQSPSRILQHIGSFLAKDELWGIRLHWLCLHHWLINFYTSEDQSWGLVRQHLLSFCWLYHRHQYFYLYID